MAAKRRHKEVKGNFHYLYGIVFIVVIILLYAAIHAIYHVFPTPLQIVDEPKNPESFIAEQARNYLRPLVELGPRVTGHKNNEIRAVDYLKQEIEAIANQVHINQKITYDVQVQSGSFFLDFKPNGAINVYENIQNVVAKIHSKKESARSVLINAHFDTVPNSPGGSDDGVNVAIMLEIMRKLSRLPEGPTHNIIFLFNGAEEAALFGSHAFITGHHLAKEVRVFINLEAIGAGGKEILFQTGPDEPWLLKYYDVPHPHGNVGAEEIFQSNIIPSDTDFRIFRDYGGIVGYDFAYYKDGWRYHTKYDAVDNIELGSIQHTGDNILKLVRNLAEAPELANPKTGEGKSVFFDVFGLFFMHYSMTANAVFNGILFAVSVLLMMWGCVSAKLGGVKVSLLYVALLFFVTILGWIIAWAIVLITASILDASNRSMSWYSVPLLSFPLYIIPTCASMLITTVILNRVIRHKTLTLSGKVILQVHVTRLIWTVPFAATTVVGWRIGIFFMFGILFNIVAVIIAHALYAFKIKGASKTWPPIYIICTIIPTMIIYLYAYQDLGLMIPILGRFGPGVNPDLIIALLVSSFTISIGSYYVPMFTYLKKPWYVIALLVVVFISGIILAYTPVGFPYAFSEAHPRLQRYSIYHTKRIIRDDLGNVIKADSGFHFIKNDRNTPHSIEGEVSFLKDAVSIKDDCKMVPGCGLPVTNSRSIEHVDESIWIPSKTSPFDTDIKYHWTETDISPTKKSYSIEVTGSDRIDAYLSMREGCTLTELSLLDEIPDKSIKWNDQVTYYISFVYGKTAESLKFSFTVECSFKWLSPPVDLAITTKFVHDDLFVKTDEYRRFLDEFPEWTVITVSGLAQYENVILI